MEVPQIINFCTTLLSTYLMSYFSVFFLISTCKGLLDSPGLNIRAKTAGPDTESTKFCGKKRRKHNMRGTEVSAISKKKCPQYFAKHSVIQPKVHFLFALNFLLMVATRGILEFFRLSKIQFDY